MMEETLVSVRGNIHEIQEEIIPDRVSMSGTVESSKTNAYTNADLGLWGFLATIAMLFAGFSSAYLVRRAAGDWLPIAAPQVLYWNTLILVFSSAGLEIGRVALRAGKQSAFRSWTFAGTLLGFAFLAGQVIAWKQLVDIGIFLPTSPHSSFFYIFSGLHGVHLLGGVGWLLYSFGRAWGDSERGYTALRLCATYWHFLTAIWLFIFYLLFSFR